MSVTIIVLLIYFNGRRERTGILCCSRYPTDSGERGTKILLLVHER